MNSENSLLESTLGFMITDYDVLERRGGGGGVRKEIRSIVCMVSTFSNTF